MKRNSRQHAWVASNWDSFSTFMEGWCKNSSRMEVSACWMSGGRVSPPEVAQFLFPVPWFPQKLLMSRTNPWLQLVINKSRGAYQAYNGWSACSENLVDLDTLKDYQFRKFIPKTCSSVACLCMIKKTSISWSESSFRFDVSTCSLVSQTDSWLGTKIRWSESSFTGWHPS
jgi:hypothetical protein